VFDGLDAGNGWCLRVRPGAERKGSGGPAARRQGGQLGAGSDPSLGHQLFPTSYRPNEVSAAVAKHCSAIGIAMGGLAHVDTGAVQKEAISSIKAHYRHHPRQMLLGAGALLPASLTVPLLAELERTRWPSVDHRAGMQCSHYLVLYIGKSNSGYEALLAEVGKVLQYTDPEYACTHVAVTKNFEGSPHIDARDTSYQYATSLGAFSDGGELCVESATDPTAVHVLNTHGRIAQIDGRFIHWVRGHGGGDRYSVIFYSTNESRRTEPAIAFNAKFVPAGALLSNQRVASD
jgi:hypothetical protein